MTLRVAIVTGTRAEYGLLRPLMKLLSTDPFFDLRIVATGAHLSPEFGLTYREIESDGFPLSEKIEMLVAGDSGGAMARSTGMGVIGLAAAFERLQPELVVLLGDRFEAFAAASAAHMMRIPIAHIHGGELTEGAVDDALRHAITKMSALHFTSTEQYRRRVVQLGEQPDRVFAVGAPGLDNVLALEPATREEIEAAAGFVFGEKLALVTYHPVTLDAEADAGLEALLSALDAHAELSVLVTMPNADAHSRGIAERLESWTDARGNAAAVKSLGWRLYLSAMRYADVVAGNSSSGIIEAPSFGVPTVDVGDRQRGRTAADSVLHADSEPAAVRGALDRALTPGFREIASRADNPYGDGHASERIAAQIKQHAETLGDLKKRFYDIDFPLAPGGDRL